MDLNPRLIRWMLGTNLVVWALLFGLGDPSRVDPAGMVPMVIGGSLVFAMLGLVLSELVPLAWGAMKETDAAGWVFFIVVILIPLIVTTL